MKKVICFLLGCLFIFSGTLIAQHVDDDTVYYTPIPLPGMEVNKNSLGSKFDTTKIDNHLYYFLFQSGALIGCKNCEGANAVGSSFTATNGLKLGEKARVGVGVGYDSYWGWQVLPLFASLSWDLFGDRNSNAFFVQLNSGPSIAWQQKSYQDYGFDRANGGRMISSQIGYRLKYHDINISFLAGVKWQRVYSYYTTPTWIWAVDKYQESTNSYSVKQDISRISLSVAIGWR